MFKWICLAVAVVLVAVLCWMINDIRGEIRRSLQMVATTSQTVNEHLPVIVDKSRKTTDTLAEHLPEIVDKTRTTTETLAELAEDIRQLKELAGIANTARDKNLVAYADSVLDTIEASGGKIGLKKTFGGGGLKNLLPAKEWVVGARKERHGWRRTSFGSPWYALIGDKEPVALLDRLKANHPASKDL